MKLAQFQQLRDKDGTFLRTRPSWFAFSFSWFLLAVSLFLVYWVGNGFRSVLNFFGVPAIHAWIGSFLPSALIVIITVLRRNRWSFELDQQHVRVKKGYLSQSKRKIQLVGWVNIDTDQSILGRLFNYGSLGFWTGDEKSRLTWWGVSSPTIVQQYVETIRDGKDSLPTQIPDQKRSWQVFPNLQTALASLGVISQHQPTEFGAPFGVYLETQLRKMRKQPSNSARIEYIQRQVAEMDSEEECDKMEIRCRMINYLCQEFSPVDGWELTRAELDQIHDQVKKAQDEAQEKYQKLFR